MCRGLEAVSAVDRDAILAVVAKQNVRVFLRVLVASAKRDMPGQLIPEGESAAVAVSFFTQALVQEAARLFCVFVEELRREQGLAQDIPRRGMADVIQLNVV